jgi:hypothetical protein
VEYGQKIGQILADKGCLERFGIDFVISRENDEIKIHAIEINLRWGGTSHPFVAAKYITDGTITPDGKLCGQDDEIKYYMATDTIQNDKYAGLQPEDFLDMVSKNEELQFDPEMSTGVIFHLLSSLSVFGKFGFTAIGNSSEDAKNIYDRCCQVFDIEA